MNETISGGAQYLKHSSGFWTTVPRFRSCQHNQVLHRFLCHLRWNLKHVRNLRFFSSSEGGDLTIYDINISKYFSIVNIINITLSAQLLKQSEEKRMIETGVTFHKWAWIEYLITLKGIACNCQCTKYRSEWKYQTLGALWECPIVGLGQDQHC